MESILRIIVNGVAHEISRGATVLSLMKDLKINPDQVAVEINLTIIDRAEFKNRSLQEGDKVEVISFVGGGQFSGDANE